MFLFFIFSFLITVNGIVNEQKRFRVERQPESNYFLPEHIYPLKYELLIIPYFEGEVLDPYYTGEVNITFKVREASSSRITLNVGEGLDVNYSSIRVVSNYGQVFSTSTRPVDRETQLFTISIDNENFQPSMEYKLTIRFEGKITNASYGLYRGSYIEPDENITRYYLGTQLRPVYARQLFPCLDEPKFKATFVLTVEHPNDFIARSNMPMGMMTQPGFDGRRQTTFQETPLMSTFLLSLFVFQFSSFDSDSGFPVIHSRYKGWAVPSKIFQMEWSQQICPILVDITERYFGSELPVPKMDQIALPQHVVIAMENWGINVYRESNVLADQFSSLRQRQTVGRFTAHEIFHHWIGDLVTLKWWDHLWVHEALAMYFEYYLPDQMTPSWRMMDQFIADLTVEGLHGDNFNSPLTSRVITRQEITNKFSGLTYTKGPAIIRMLESLVGTNNLRRALQDLVAAKKYSTVTPQELWQSFDRYTKIDVNKMMSTWTDQGSYPILFVQRDLTTNTIIIDQNSSDDYAGAKTGQIWHIPISYTIKSESRFDKPPLLVMHEPKLKLKQVSSSNDWIIVNLRFSGYYRILYEDSIMQLIIKQLQENHSEIHYLNRAQLIDDIFEFSNKKISLFRLAFQLVSYLHKEREYVPLRIAFRAFREIDARLQFTKLYEKYKNLMRLFLRDIYNDIGFDEKLSEEPLDKLNREQIIEWACYYGVEDCHIRTSILLENTIRDRMKISSLPADIRSTVMCYAVKYGTTEFQNYFIHEINIRNTDGAANEINALACSPQNHLLDILNKRIPNEKWIDMFEAIISREENSLMAAMYLTRNLDNIFERFGEDITVNFIRQLQAKTSLQGITSNLAMNLKTSVSQVRVKIQNALSDLFGSINRNDIWLRDHLSDLESSVEESTNVLQIANYYTKQPYNYYDSFYFTKFIHSQLYNTTRL